MSTVDSVLKQTSGDVAREAEVERIIRAFKLNPYDILDLPIFADDSTVKKTYRKKSLLIHPDKFKHERGDEAFDLLKKVRQFSSWDHVQFLTLQAEGQLLEKSKREEIDGIMTYARTLVLKSVLGAGYSLGVTTDDPRLANLTPSFEAQIRTQAKELFVEDELSKRRRTKLAHANEGEERARQEAEVANRKRKKEEQVKWEENREERVGNWRNFRTVTEVKKAKKAKKNLNVLG
ncbi:J domain-containing protein spf31 [Vanrija pseudolonga]|uniref:J domain-containing protein spf31 n=1 Tax=Vanrija pseudolonga TaxID=143232 RepID=A0AAF0YJL3_9TREE|nr:J domain-containing protein spf31 [Vanrija pseudolonga]